MNSNLTSVSNLHGCDSDRAKSQLQWIFYSDRSCTPAANPRLSLIAARGYTSWPCAANTQSVIQRRVKCNHNERLADVPVVTRRQLCQGSISHVRGAFSDNVRNRKQKTKTFLKNSKQNKLLQYWQRKKATSLLPPIGTEKSSAHTGYSPYFTTGQQMPTKHIHTHRFIQLPKSWKRIRGLLPKPSYFISRSW